METRRLASFGRLRLQNAQLARAHVKSMHYAFLVIAIKRVAISRIEQHIKPIGTGEGRPITVADAFLALHCAWTNPVAIILQSTCDPINRARVVQRDAVEFASWDPIQMFPALAAGVALINATIVSDNQTQRDRRFRWLVLVLGFRRLRRRRTSI